MTLRLVTFLILLLSLAANVAAMEYDGRCNIRFFGESTLHDFEGHVDCQPFLLVSQATPSGGQLIRTAQVAVLVKEMDTDNSSRDQKLRAMFEGDSYPQIIGHFAELDPVQILHQLETAGQEQGTMDFELQIRDVRQKISATTRTLAVTPERSSFVLEFPVSLARFALEPPSVLGFIRVADQVRVEVQVFLQQRAEKK